jgi:hypothetical protein
MSKHIDIEKLIADLEAGGDVLVNKETIGRVARHQKRKGKQGTGNTPNGLRRRISSVLNAKCSAASTLILRPARKLNGSSRRGGSSIRRWMG